MVARLLVHPAGRKPRGVGPGLAGIFRQDSDTVAIVGLTEEIGVYVNRAREAGSLAHRRGSEHSGKRPLEEAFAAALRGFAYGKIRRRWSCLERRSKADRERTRWLKGPGRRSDSARGQLRLRPSSATGVQARRIPRRTVDVVRKAPGDRISWAGGCWVGRGSRAAAGAAAARRCDTGTRGRP